MAMYAKNKKNSRGGSWSVADDALAACVVTDAHHEAAKNGVLIPNELQGKGKMAPQDANGGALMDLSVVLG